MKGKRDYYEVLGVPRGADAGAIKKSYRRLAKQYHPDTNAGNARAEERFKEVTEAYEILSDPEKRKLYDQFGHAAFDGSMPGGDAGGYQSGGFGGSRNGSGSYHYTGPNGSYQEYHFEGGNMDDILKGFFGGGFHGSDFTGGNFSDDSFHSNDYGSSGFDGSRFRRSSFGSGFDSNSSGSAFSNGKGADLQSEISVSFDDAIFGCDKVIQFRESGPGSPDSKTTLQVHIPAGISDGKTIRLRGKGQPGRGGGQPGDLLITVHVGTRPGFERRDDDIYTTVNIPFTTAVFGGEAIVDTLYGKVKCKIAAGTQSGSKIRLKGKGVVSMNQPNHHGDQYVTVQIQVPRNLNETAKQKLREFERAS